MNIGIVTERFYPDSYADAIRIKSIVDRLKDDEDLEITIHTSTSNSRDSEYKIKQNIVPPTIKSGKFLRAFNELLLAVEIFFRIFFSKKYDLIIVTSPPFFVMLSCAIAAYLRQIPYTLDIRDIYPRVFFLLDMLRENSFFGKSATYFEEFIYEKALGIVAVTEGIRKDISDRITEKSKVITIRNGYSKKIFSYSNKKYEEFTVSFHGNIGRLQDVNLILEIAKKCSDENLDINFIIIGDGAQSHLIEKTNLENLKYFGRLPHKETAKIISKAHIGISFRTNELVSRNSFPVKVYEYIGAGLPIVVTPISEGGKFVERNEIGYQFNPEQRDKIYNAIKDLYIKPIKLEHLKNNIKNIRELHTREYLSNKYYDFIKNKLDSKLSK